MNISNVFLRKTHIPSYEKRKKQRRLNEWAVLVKYLYYSIKRQYLLLIYATITVSSMEVSCKCESPMQSVLYSIHHHCCSWSGRERGYCRNYNWRICLCGPGQSNSRGLQGTATSVLKTATDAPNKHFLKSNCVSHSDDSAAIKQPVTKNVWISTWEKFVKWSFISSSEKFIMPQYFSYLFFLRN